MILASARITFYPLTIDDHLYFHKLNTDSHVRRFLWDDKVISSELALEILEKNTRYFEKHDFGLWKMKSKVNRALIGYAGLWYFFEELQPQLIYVIDRKYTGLGYASEASRQIITYAFNSLSFEYLIAAMDSDHLASQKVASEAGMKFTEEKMIDGKRTFFYRIEKENLSSD